MKTGILTFHFAHNYGAMLQAYALKTFLNNEGHEAEIINYVPLHMIDKYFQKDFVHMIATFKRSLIVQYCKQRRNIKRFNAFETDFFHINVGNSIGKSKLSGRTGDWDFVIFGSDQIWNTFITKNDMTYFADFLEDGKAVAYAASCGNALSSEAFRTAVDKYLHRFKRISVREKNAKAFLKSALDIHAECVLDPVFLLSSDYWLDLAEQGKMQTVQDFIFFYTVQDNLDLASECNTFADEKGMKVYSVHGEMKKCNDQSELRAGAGPLEFLYYIKHANYIYTNSFHAVAFSILFRKKAYVRVHSETGNRIVDLLNECGISWDGQGMVEVDGSLCLDNLTGLINKSKEFLLDSIKMD